MVNGGLLMKRSGIGGERLQSDAASGNGERGVHQDELMRILSLSPRELEEQARAEQEADASRRAANGSSSTARTGNAAMPRPASELDGQERRNISRRGFITGAAAGLAAATAGIAATKIAGGIASDRGGNNGGNVSERDLDNAFGETEKYHTLRDTFAHIDNERFDEDPGRIFNDIDAIGSHLKAWEAGEREGNERKRHWVAYNIDLQNNPEFTNRYAEAFNGLQTADDHGAFYEHIVFTSRPVAAAELIALKHPEFANLSLEQAENKLREISDERPDDALVYKEWLESRYTQTEYKFVDIPKGVFHNLGIEDRNAEHGMFTTCDASEILRNDKNQLVEATTTLDDGTKVTRYINPVCTNILNVIKINGKTYTISEDKPPTPTTPDNPPDTPDNPPDTPDNPPDTPDEPSDAKNPEAIEQNMQTGDETSNWVEPSDSGEVSSRPDTSQDSYIAEQNYYEPSEPTYAADQTYATHETYTPEQQQAQEVAAQEMAAQNAADAAAQEMASQAQQNAQMTDAEAADWFNSL